MSKIPTPGIAIIKEFEGCKLDAYPDPLSGNLPITIGWGSTRRRDGTPFKMGDRITQAEADSLLLWKLENSFLPPMTRIPIWPRLNEQQAGAVLSFAYNLGAGFYGSRGFETITRVLRDASWAEIEFAFSLYRNPGSPVEEGLLRRRVSEARLFLSGTPGVSLSAAATTYLAVTPQQRTHRQNRHLSDQAIAYIAFIRANPQPSLGNPPPDPAPPPAPVPTPPQSTTPPPPRILQVTTPLMTGDDVREIQTALNQAGAQLQVDGVFGPGSRTAVEQYQRANGLPVTGQVDGATRTRLLQRVLHLTSPPMTGPDVEAVQRQLRLWGFGSTPDGIFGPATRQAVEQFQRAAGLVVDGVVGPRTQTLISTRPMALTQPPLRGEDVEGLQRALNRAGVMVAIDGVFGPGTDWAVKQFQARNLLVADGVVGPRTLARLI